MIIITSGNYTTNPPIFYPINLFLQVNLTFLAFSDEYCNNLLMNYFIKTKNYKDAAKVAAIQMLQEDFSNEITKNLALYSCLKYLQEPIPWNAETKEEVEKTEDNDDEDEEVKVRVKFLRNPYFDGHFDLKSPNELIGKTLMTIGRLNENSISQSYYLVGLGLCKESEGARRFLEKVQHGEVKVSKDSVDMFKKYIVSGDLSAADINTADVSEDIQNLLSLANQVTSSATDVNLLLDTDKKLKDVVKKFEAQEIEKQKKVRKKFLVCIYYLGTFFARGFCPC